jgi:hypothetical protein
MHSCPCGDPAKDAANKCARCAAVRTLDLPIQASEKDIEHAYRNFVKAWHPDRFQSDEKLRGVAEEKMRNINAAYLFLTSEPATSSPPPDEQSSCEFKTHSDEAVPFRSYPNRWQLICRSLPRPSKLMGIAALVAGICVAIFLLKGIDSYLTSKPIVGEQYSSLKTFLSVKLREKTGSVWGDAWHQLFSPEHSTVAAADPQHDVAAQSGRPEKTPHNEHRYEPNATQFLHVKALPYITAGLTKAEVIAIQGTPESASEEKLTYGRTEFYFSDNKLSGWKIDPTSDPARVKLWPEAAVDPNLQTFTVGSTKDQVIAVQGTPTLFSEDKFGYEDSEVYFQNGQVIGWKADPSSVPLRATAR